MKAHARESLIGLWREVERQGNRPTVRAVIAAARLFGEKFSNDEARELLSAFSRRTDGLSPERDGAPNEHEQRAEVQTRSKRGAPSRARDKVLLVPSPSTLPGIPVAEAPVSPPEPKPGPDEAWDARLRHPEWFLTILDTLKPHLESQMRSLSADVRFALARYHAYRWANCRRDEGRNRQAAMKIASGLAELATSRQYATLEILEYVARAEETWRLRGGKPWFAPWEIRAVEEAV